MTKSNNSKEKKAFTIIEAILVLAVAGLILLMVLLVIPAARRMTRNNQRKQAMSQLLRAIDQFVQDTNGISPIEDLTQPEIYRNFDIIVADYLGADCIVDPHYTYTTLHTGGGDIYNYQYRIVDKNESNPANNPVCKSFTDPSGDGFGIDIRTHGPAGVEDMYFTIETARYASYTDKYTGTNMIGDPDGTHYDVQKYWSNFLTIFPEAYCLGKEGKVAQSKGEPSNIAIAYILEGGAVACVDNSGGRQN